MFYNEITDILATTTGVLLGLHFLTFSNNKKSNIYIGLFLLLFSLEIVISLVESFLEEEPSFLYAIIPNSFVYYPCLLNYIVSIIVAR